MLRCAATLGGACHIPPPFLFNPTLHVTYDNDARVIVFRTIGIGPDCSLVWRCRAFILCRRWSTLCVVTNWPPEGQSYSFTTLRDGRLAIYTFVSCCFVVMLSCCEFDVRTENDDVFEHGCGWVGGRFGSGWIDNLVWTSSRSTWHLMAGLKVEASNPRCRLLLRKYLYNCIGLPRKTATTF